MYYLQEISNLSSSNMIKKFSSSLALALIFTAFLPVSNAFAGVLVRRVVSAGQNTSTSGSTRTLRSTQVMRMTMPSMRSGNYNGIAELEKQRQADYKYELELYKWRVKQYEAQKKEVERVQKEKQRQQREFLREAKRSNNGNPREKGFFGKLLSGEPTNNGSGSSYEAPRTTRNERIEARTKAYSTTKDRERLRNDDNSEAAPSMWTNFWAWLRKVFLGY